MRDEWREVALGEVVTRRKDFTPVIGEELYRVVGVQRSGWGLVHRDPIRGNSMKFDKLLRLRTADLVYRTITAFEAPIAVVTPDFDGAFVTPQTFPTYAFDHSQLIPGYMALLTTSPAFHEEMASRCVGSVLRRKTLSQGAFESITVALPPLDEQRRIVDLIAALDAAIKAAETEAEASFAALESARDLLIWHGVRERIDFGDVATIAGGLVDPKAAAHNSLPHIGTERIEARTGDLAGVVSASEDGVTSSKFLHEAGTIVYSKIRPNLRKVAIPSWRGLCSADAYPILPRFEGDVSFLRHLLVSRPFTKEAVARSGRTKMPKINKTELMSIQVPVVRGEDQVKIASVLDSIDQARVSARTTVEALRSLRSNLLTVLLSGDHEMPTSYDELLEVA